MKQFRLFLQTVLFAALVLSMSLQANISPLAFNGIFKCFKPGYEMYAPNLGCAALQTGLVNALRFYTTIPGENDSEGRRLWINDKAPQNDPVAALVLLLFPSPAGNLTAMTSHPKNIGRHLTVYDIAQLLNFCARVRTAVSMIKENRSLKGNEFGKKIKNTLKLICQALDTRADRDTITSSDTTTGNKKTFKNLLYANRTLDAYFRFLKIPERFLQLPHVHLLLSLLCRCIELEERDDRKNAFMENPLKYTSFECYQHNTFYSKFTPEMLLNAFFCLKFSKNDIPELLQHLDDLIVDHEQLTEARLIDKSDIESVKQKEIANISLDDLWVIQNRDLIDQVIPYARGCEPVNNGLASEYDRAQDLLLNNKNQEFPDCTETTIRHLCNLVLFHKEGSFLIEKTLEQLSNSSIKNLSANLQAFYALQSPDKANSGERSVRDAWSKVVSDLGDPVRYKGNASFKNLKNTSEISAGIINIIRVLNIIFNLELDPEPIYQNNQLFTQRVAEWAENGLEKLFQIISPEKKINIEFSGVEAFKAFGDYEYDCIGTINVTINQDFKFTLRVSRNHAQFDTIDILVPEKALLNEEFLNQVITKFLNPYSETISESIFLLNNKTKDLVTTPAYKLFKNSLNDSIEIIKALEILLEMTEQNEISLTRSAQILKNLLHNFLWQDPAIIQKIQPILKKWTRFAFERKNQGIINALQDEVKSVQYDLFCEDFNNNADDLLDFFHNVQSLFCSQKSNIFSFSLLKNHESIKTINLSQSNISALEISGLCYNLEKIDLGWTTVLKSVKLSGTLENLKSIILYESRITELEISGNRSPNLEELNLSNTKNLKSLKLSGTLQKLKYLNLIESNITELEISGVCPNLESLNLSQTTNLISLKLLGTLQNLKSIILYGSGVAKLKISGSRCPNLEKIDLHNTTRLKSLSLSECLQNLKCIDLFGSAITTLEISGDTCSKLETLNLSQTKQLTSLKLSGTLHYLKTIAIYGSAILKIKVFRDCCPNLQSCNPNIEIIDLKRKDHDGEIELPDAKKQCLNDISEN